MSVREVLMTCYYDDMTVEEAKAYAERVGLNVSDRQVSNAVDYIAKVVNKEWK